MDIKPRSGCRWDLVALGEVMLRLDPGDRRITTARRFEVWEGGGEYNVARSLRACFGLDTALVTAFADNPVGRLLETLIRAGGVDQSHVVWMPYDGVGRVVRNGLNFTERGFGVRAGLGCSDRGHSAAAQIRAGDVPWEVIFSGEGARWFHTGGIYAALSDSSQAVAAEAMRAAREAGTVVSYDLNYRASLWRDHGGPERAREVNRELVSLADVLVGNEEDYPVALGVPADGVGAEFSTLDPEAYASMLRDVLRAHSNLKLAAVTLRRATTASRNDWGAVCSSDGRVWVAPVFRDLEVYDRVGGGDSFASGLFYGLLSGADLERAVHLGVAHGALAMTTPGDASMVTLAEVEALVRGGGARISR
ncbi:MAG TPA: sugar kinase [Candidatus Binatia bacterium]|nr:sugar kinase [Candidatus Binatia bacterium]